MKVEKNAKNRGNYFIGLDIGTDSVGYAVTDEGYKPLKYNSEPMMGTHLMDATEENIKRRAFRTARRRLDRRQQRVNFIREIFACEIAEIDSDFFKRLDASALFSEDKLTPSRNSFFNDENYTDKDYHREYPTIHHLICDLMQGKARKDPRLLYLAIAYLVAHRGHFLNEVDKDNIEGVLDFDRLYKDFDNYFEAPLWTCEPSSLSLILKKKIGINKKTAEINELLFGGKKPKVTDDDMYDKSLIVKLLAGGEVKPDALYLNAAYSELPKVSLSMSDEAFEAVLSELGDDGELLILMKKLYDWSILAELVPDGRMISETKVKVYEQHKADLKYLKSFIRKYFSGKYREIFRSSNIPNNYVAYSYNLKNVEDASELKKKANKVDFCDYILKIVKDAKVDECDTKAYEDMISRLNKENASFLPKQVDGDNRVIPYQLYYAELVKILDEAKSSYSFLTVKDEVGLTPYDKILSTFLYRVPYYVGPLNKAKSKNAWVERKKEKIYPWNFEKVVDLDKSEQAFIKRMTNKCTYLPGEDVLAKNSLIYSRFEVLNEINNLRINGDKIDVETKQSLFAEKFMKTANVTPKRIKEFLISTGKMTPKDNISGIDETVKSSLKPYLFFKPYIENGILKENDVESIISAKAYSEDPFRFKRWLASQYPTLNDSDVKKISSQKFKDFGRLSKRFLCEFEGTCKATGEVSTIMDLLWNTNKNLMQLLSDEYTFAEQIENFSKEYYRENPLSLSERIGEMYIPNAVKRPVIRTLDIVKSIAKVQKHAPTKIFVEMARGADEEKKNKRTVSRRDQILEFYKAYGETDEIRILKEELGQKDDRELRGEALFLYFTQLGRCMYSGERLSIGNLGTSLYNVDHIYPRSFVKDDSVVNNKVLVLSNLNDEKKNEYPIRSDIRTKMHGYWQALNDKGLISEEKYKRLIRATPFSEEERWGFINRQLVETRQSTKAVATLLKEMYPDTEIVYVKAGLVSEFRQEFDLLKARSVNDLHHAKDAYLNIVVGNVYNSKFTKKWFNPTMEDYSLKVNTIFNYPQAPGGVTVWKGRESIDFVKKVMSKSFIHLTRYAFCRHGGFFDQMPLKAGTNDMLVPRKKGLDPEKYGGYNKTTASFFILVKYEAKRKDVVILPVEFMYADKFIGDLSFAEAYAKESILKIFGEEARNISFPLGMRKIKVNTVLELDGFKVFLSGKSNNRLVISSLTSFIINLEWERYVKHLESFAEKRKTNPNFRVSSKYDKITAEQNAELYDLYLEKAKTNLFSKTLCSSVIGTLESGKERFEKLSAEDQVTALLNIGTVFKTGRKGGCDLGVIGGVSKAGALFISAKLSNLKKTYKNVCIVDSDASGIFEKRTDNLLELL